MQTILTLLCGLKILRSFCVVYGIFLQKLQPSEKTQEKEKNKPFDATLNIYVNSLALPCILVVLSCVLCACFCWYVVALCVIATRKTNYRSFEVCLSLKFGD